MNYTFSLVQLGPNAPETGGNANTNQICILVLYALDSQRHCLALLLLLLDCMQAGGEPAAVVGGKYSDVIEAVTRRQVSERERGERGRRDFSPGGRLQVSLATDVDFGKIMVLYLLLSY